jgi:hypothetical protein
VTYWNPIRALPSLSSNARWYGASVAQITIELLPSYFFKMCDVLLIVVILKNIIFVIYISKNDSYKNRPTPYVEEKGIFASFRGATMRSMRVVEFSRNVSM